MPPHSTDDDLAQALANLNLSTPPPWRSQPLKPTIPLLSLTYPNITLTLTPPPPTLPTSIRASFLNQAPPSPNLLAPPSPSSRKRQRSPSTPSSPSFPSSPSPSPTPGPNKRRRMTNPPPPSTRSVRPPRRTASSAASSRAAQLLRRDLQLARLPPLVPARLPPSAPGPVHPSHSSVTVRLANGIQVPRRLPGAEERRGGQGERR